VAATLEMATFRDRVEAWEHGFLSPLAARSYPARRAVPEEDSPVRTPFQRDRDRIVHAKAFRRLKHKTQVFISPQGDHFRTRLTHTIETCCIARTVARALALNEDLAEAIGLGHDLGHPPFGHIGEDVLDRRLRERFGRRFRHNEHSLRVVDRLEHDGRGLNLTVPVRDGILRHTGDEPPATLEGRIVRLVDRIAYINHDIDDAVRAGVLRAEELPRAEIETLGETGTERIDTLVRNLVAHSPAAGDIVQGDEVGEAMARLRTFMFDRVYLGAAVRAEQARIDEIVSGLFEACLDRPPEPLAAGASEVERVVDWIAGMTDRYAERAYAGLGRGGGAPAAHAPAADAGVPDGPTARVPAA
jgi:dGTPase